MNNGQFVKSKLYGVGVDDTDYPKEKRVYSEGKSKVIWYCEVFSRWRNMLKRCYSNTDEAYTDVTVCDDWLSFSNYKNWVDSQVKPDCDWDIDKDLINGSSRMYSPENCVVIPKCINLYLFVSKGKGLVGSYYESKRGKYQSYCGEFGGKRKTFGRFDTEFEAHRMWQLEKSKQLHIALDWYRMQNYSQDIVIKSLVSVINKIDNEVYLNLPTGNLYL